MDEQALDVRLLAEPETVDAGDEVSWRLTITNVGQNRFIRDDGARQRRLDPRRGKRAAARPEERKAVADETAGGHRDNGDGCVRRKTGAIESPNR